MKVGDKVYIKEEAWSRFLNETGNPSRIITEPKSVAAINPKNGSILLNFPMWWWKEEDLLLAKNGEDESKVVSLDDHRIRAVGEFNDEQVAYVEALWGKNTYAFNAAVRDLEAMRRGEDNKVLRPPETYHEALHLILHVRALANDMARHFGLEEMVRESDDLPNRELSPIPPHP